MLYVIHGTLLQRDWLTCWNFRYFRKGIFTFFLKTGRGDSATRPYIVIMWEKNHRTCGIYMNNDWLYKYYKAYTIKFKRQKKRNKENIERRKRLVYQKTSLLHWALNLISLYLDRISDMPNKIYFTTLKRIVTKKVITDLFLEQKTRSFLHTFHGV